MKVYSNYNRVLMQCNNISSHNKGKKFPNPYIYNYSTSYKIPENTITPSQEYHNAADNKTMVQTIIHSTSG